MILEHQSKRQRVSLSVAKHCEEDETDHVNDSDDASTTAAAAMAPKMPQSPRKRLGNELQRLLEGFDPSPATEDGDRDGEPLLRRARQFHTLLVLHHADTAALDAAPQSPCSSPLPPAGAADDSRQPLASLDAALVARVHVHLVLLLSRALVEPAGDGGRGGGGATGTNPSVNPDPNALRLLLESLEAIYRLAGTGSGTGDGTAPSGLFTPGACREVAAVCTRLLDHFLWWSTTWRDEPEDRGNKMDAEATEEWTVAVAACLRVLDHLAPGPEALGADALLTVVAAAAEAGQTRWLRDAELLRWLDGGGDRPDGAPRRRARAVRAALEDADADGLVDYHGASIDDLFRLQCILWTYRAPLSDADVTALVQVLPDMVGRLEKTCPEQARQAVDCLTVLCDRPSLLGNLRVNAIEESIVKAIRRVLMESRGVDVRRSLSSGLDWCRRRQLVPILLGYSDQTDCRPAVISSLLEILFDQALVGCKADPLILMKMYRQDVLLTKLLICIMDLILRDVNNHGSMLLISETDIFSIFAVLMEHQNDDVAVLSACWLCHRLPCTFDESESDISYVASLGHAALRFLQQNQHFDTVANIIGVWSTLTTEVNSAVSAALTREPTVLAVLVEVLSDGALPHATRAQAVHLLTRLGRDVCNRRILSSHHGLLPCLIRCVREDSDLVTGLGGAANSVDRDTVKTCIMNLAMAL